MRSLTNQTLANRNRSRASSGAPDAREPRERGGAPERERGFTLIEVVGGLSALMVVVAVVGLGLQTGVRASRGVHDLEQVHAQAQGLMDTILAQSFGATADPNPTAAQIDEIFDDDDISGDVTVQQLTRYPPADGGWVFTLTAFAVPGTWRVSIDADLNDDGSVAGTLEKSNRVLRIRIFFDERLVLATEKATETTT